MRLIILAAIAAALTSSALSAAQKRPLTQWYTDYATIEQGGSITTPSKLHSNGFEIEGVIGGKSFPQGRGSIGVVFSDKLRQREEFTIDLGQTRKLGFITFDCELPRRMPESLTIQLSNENANGPWRTILDVKTDVMHNHTVGLDNEVPARWVRVDLGENTDGIGSRVGRVHVYPRFRLIPAVELIQDFQKSFRRDMPELAAFWKAIDEKRWTDACDEIIKRQAERGKPMLPPPGGPAPKAPERAQMWMENRVEDQGFVYQFTSSDWDWRALKKGAPTPNLGFLPGAYSIFNDLANAWLNTREERYARKAAELLTDWLQDNPYPGWHMDRDGNFANGWAGLHTSGRCGVFNKLACAFCMENKFFTRDLKINLIYSIWQHMTLLDAIRTEVGGNWLTNVNSGLFGNALEYPEYVEQKQWLANSMESFEKSLTKDVYPCGREVEDSTQYVPIASGQMLGQYVKVRKAGLKLSDESERRMSQLWDAIAWVQFPDGSGTALGDCFRLSPLRKGWEFAPKEFIELFDRQDLVYMNTQGKEGQVPKETSRSFAGWYVMRSPWEEKPFEDARQLFFKNTQNRTHGHLDQLQITLYAYGREFLTDPAMTGYGLPSNATARSTKWHNTIQVNELDQDEKEGKENAWCAGKGADFADGEFHYGTVIGRRQVLFLKSGKGLSDYWLVSDYVTGRREEHTFDINFHLPEDAKPVVEDKSVRTGYTDANLLIFGAGNAPVPSLQDYWIADRLRGEVPAKCTRFRIKAIPAARFDTFLVPYKGAKAPEFACETIPTDEPDNARRASALAVKHAQGTDIALTNVEPGRKLSFNGGKLVTDAQALILRFDKAGKLVYGFQYGGSETIYAGKSVIRVQSGTAFTEL